MDKTEQVRYNIINFILTSKICISLDVYVNEISPLLEQVGKTKDKSVMKDLFKEIKSIYKKFEEA